jgi:hypothetical protein
MEIKPRKRFIVSGSAERTLFNGLAKRNIDLVNRALEKDGADPDAKKTVGGNAEFCA